jgi:hypothetical protein
MGEHTDPERDRTGTSQTEPSAEEILGVRPETSELESALARPARSKRSFSSTMLLVLGVVVAVGFVGGLLLGRATAPEDTALPASFPGGGNFPGGGTGATGGNFPGGAGFTAGTIQRIDGDTIYVETVDGQTVEVRTSGDTDVQVTSEGSVNDLAEGETVIVQGDQQDDGSLEATSISEGGFGGGFPGAPGANG